MQYFCIFANKRITKMANWQNFYLQRMGTDAYGQAFDWHESVGDWGVWCKSIPFKAVEKVKEPAKRSWNDEHGDDEYISASGMWVDSYDITVEFGCKIMDQPIGDEETRTVNDIRATVKSFLADLRQFGMMKMYSKHTGIGRQYVRLSSVSDNAHFEREYDGGSEFIVFSVTFKVNDPVTDVEEPQI